MSASDHRRALWQLHACVLLWGFTAILGKIITLPAMALVIWRMLIVVGCLALWPRVWRGLKIMSAQLQRTYAALGCVIALHWLSFYGAIKLANASVAVACLALGSVSAAIIEPLVFRRKHKFSELALGVLAIPGVVLLIGGVPLDMQLGVFVGVISAVLTAIFAVLSKKFVSDADTASITFIEMIAGTVLLILVASTFSSEPWFAELPSTSDLGWLWVLALFCTLLPFLLWLSALHHISAFTTQLTLNLEPVYAIALAALLFGEHRELTLSFYAGVAVILATLLLQPLIQRRLD
jgi:drug/metabolite transporter (DMT)-like permease